MQDYKKSKAQLIGELQKLRQQLELKGSSLSTHDNSEHTLRILKENQQHLPRLIMDGFVIVNMDGRIDGYNEIFKNMIGYDDHEIHNLTYRDFTPEKWHDFEQQIVDEQIIPNGVSDVYEKEYRRKDGSVIAVELKTFLARDERGAPEGMWAVVRDISGRKKIETSLRESEQRFRRVFEDGLVGIVFANESFVFDRVNNAFCNMMGYTEEELLTKSFVDITHPDDQQRDRENVMKLAMGEIPFYRTKKKYIKKNGEVIWGNLIVSSLRDDKGSFLGFLAMILDITDSTLSEERIASALAEKEALLRELYHRTKNNMQVICSLLSLQSRRIEDVNTRTIFTEMSNRIRSMALVHQKLYQSRNLSRVNLKDYIEDLADLLSTSYRTLQSRISILVTAEPVDVSIDVAIPCGLILNEMITNAFKHAFPEDMRGIISVNLRQTDDGFIELVVSDNGVGLPEGYDIADADKMGIQTIRSLGEKQLGGEVLFKSDNGLSCSLRIVHKKSDERV
jgi:PAS domain S-box-containing protein